MKGDLSRVAEELVAGAIDLHVHTGPDVFPRLLTDVEAARQAKEAGMKAILIKSHVTITSDRAKIAADVTGFDVYGGLALNLPVGGINPHAVEMAIRMGAKEIWMPTIHAAAYLEHSGHVPMFQRILRPGLKGLTVLDEEGRVLPQVDEVLELIAKNDVALGTGHLSVKESMALVARAKAIGVKNIIVTHPLATFVNFSIADMVEIIEKGATMLEHNINDTTHQIAHPIEPARIAEAINAIGAERSIMCTDGGQVINPPPVAMLKDFIRLMLGFGIAADDIRTMVKDNPARILGLS